MAIISIMRNFNGSPSIVFIQSTDTLAAITTTNYLVVEKPNIESANNGEFEFKSDDYCLMKYADGEGFFTVDLTNQKFVEASPPTGNYQLKSSIIAGTADLGGAGVGPINHGVPQLIAGAPVCVTMGSSTNNVGLLFGYCDANGNLFVKFTADPGAVANISFIGLTAAQNNT